VPGAPKAKVYARIIMTPQHAKSFLAAMKENISNYEQQFGEIKVFNEPAKDIKSIGFHSDVAPDASSNRP
jgi:hypothetical protein